MPAAPSYEPFSVEVVPNRAEVIVRVAGELDAAVVDELDAEVRALRASGFTAIVLDLGVVDFIDSSGLRLLLGLRNDAEREGHSLTLVPPPPAIRRIFELTRTHGLFDWRERRLA